ncbi:MAG: universal stress protein [Spirochaetota bacterium]
MTTTHLEEPLQTLLVCLDLTEIDQHLIDYSLFLGNKLSVEHVIFFHVIQAYDLPSQHEEEYENLERDLIASIDKQAQEAKNRLGLKDLHTQTVVRTEQEDAAEVVVLFTQEHKIDLTLIGNKSGEERTGYYGKKIIGQVRSDILFVPVEPEHSLEQILCLLDFSSASTRAFKRALSIQKNTECQLACRYVQDSSSSYFPDSTTRTIADLSKKAEKTIKEFLAGFGLGQEQVPCTIDVQKPIQEHISEINRLKPTLVIIGVSGQAASVTTLLGNIAETVRREEITNPVMIMKNSER